MINSCTFGPARFTNGAPSSSGCSQLHGDSLLFKHSFNPPFYTQFSCFGHILLSFPRLKTHLFSPVWVNFLFLWLQGYYGRSVSGLIARVILRSAERSFGTSIGSYLVQQRRLAQLDRGDLAGEVHAVGGSPQVVHAAVLDVQHLALVRGNTSLRETSCMFFFLLFLSFKHTMRRPAAFCAP